MNLSSQNRMVTGGSRFEHLVDLTSRADWDDEGGEAIAPEQWARVRQLVSVIAAEVPNAPEVFVTAGGDGTIHLRWSDATRSVDAEVDGGTFYWFVRSPEGKSNGESARDADVVQVVRDLFG